MLAKVRRAMLPCMFCHVNDSTQHTAATAQVNANACCYSALGDVQGTSEDVCTDVWPCKELRSVSPGFVWWRQQKTHLLAQAREGVVSMHRWDSMP